MRHTLSIAKPSQHQIKWAIAYPTQSYLPEERGPIWETGPGEYVLNQLVALIEAAQEMICIQSFVMDDNQVIQALSKAADRGVSLFAMGATVKLEEVTEEPNFSAEAYKKLLEERFKNKVLFRAANHFHGKFLICDPKTQPQGVLLTANFTQNALKKNPELAIPMTVDQVKECYALFRYYFWEEAKEEHTAHRSFKQLKPAGLFILPFPKQLLFPQQNQLRPLKSALLKAIQSAQQSIKLSTFGLDPEHEVIEAILEKARAGLEIQLFFPERANLIESACAPFIEAGAQVMIQPYLHAKCLVVDDQQGFIFSANIETKGMDQGFETGVALSEAQVRTLSQKLSNWEKGFGRLVRNTSVQDFEGALTVIEGETKRVEIIERVKKRSSPISINTLQELRKALDKLTPEQYARQTTWEMKVNLKDPPAKFTEETEVLPGLVEISRPGKKGKNPRKALLIKGTPDLASILAQLEQDLLELNVYA